VDTWNNFNHFYYPLNYSLLPFIPLHHQPAPGSTPNFLVLTGSTGDPDQLLIGPGFISKGSWKELQKAEAAYNQLNSY
jgi:hypothetical protein